MDISNFAEDYLVDQEDGPQIPESPWTTQCWNIDQKAICNRIHGRDVSCFIKAMKELVIRLKVMNNGNLLEFVSRRTLSEPETPR